MKEWLLYLSIIIFDFVQGYNFINSVNKKLIECNFVFTNLLYYMFNFKFLYFNLIFYDNLYDTLNELLIRVMNCFVFKGKCVEYVIMRNYLVCFVNISIFLIIFYHNNVKIQTFILFLIVVWTGSIDPMCEA